MSHIDQWFSEQPHRSPAEIACLLARDRFWNDEHLRLIGTHPEWPDAAWLLDLSEELAHTLILVLSRLPEVLRRDFADRFYAERVSHATEHPLDERARLAFGATAVVNVVDLLDEAVCGERTLDLLRGAAQGDDLTRTPGPAVDELRKTIARVRFDVGFEDPTNPHAVTAIALAEVLDPASEIVDLKEVFARCGWAAVETRDRSGALGFLLEVDRLLAGYEPDDQ